MQNPYFYNFLKRLLKIVINSGWLKACVFPTVFFHPFRLGNWKDWIFFFFCCTSSLHPQPAAAKGNILIKVRLWTSFPTSILINSIIISSLTSCFYSGLIALSILSFLSSIWCLMSCMRFYAVVLVMTHVSWFRF